MLCEIVGFIIKFTYIYTRHICYIHPFSLSYPSSSPNNSLYFHVFFFSSCDQVSFIKVIYRNMSITAVAILLKKMSPL